MAKKRRLIAKTDETPARRISAALLDFVGRIPKSSEHKNRNPADACRRVASAAAARAALTAGSLALPPGPLGWLTVLPELIAVWRIQAQLVADIAAIYGKKSSLTREQMLYCLFRHMASQLARDLVVRVGERYLVRHVSVRLFQTLAQAIGVRVSQRVIGKGISRWLPIIGSIGVAAYAYYDTGQVAATTIEMYERGIDVEGPQDDA